MLCTHSLTLKLSPHSLQAAPIPLILRLAQPCAVLASCVHVPVCFREAAWSLPHGLPSLVVSKEGAAIADPCCTLLLLHTHQVADGACFLVYRLHTLHAGNALVIAYLCCRRDRLPSWRMGLPLLLSTCVATGMPTHASFSC